MSPTERAPRRARTWEHALLGLLLAGTFVFPLALLRGKSATFDEVAHLPAGYSYLTTGLFKINPQHPPLIKEICAVPLLFMNLKMPVDRETLRRANPGLTYQWGFGRRFLYSQDADRILFWGRVPAVLLSFGLALMVALWARRLWGPFGALLASTLPQDLSRELDLRRYHARLRGRWLRYALPARALVALSHRPALRRAALGLVMKSPTLFSTLLSLVA